MNTLNKYPVRGLWVAGLLLTTTLVTGCGGGSGGGSGGGTITVPTVTTTSPLDAATAVALNSKLTAIFSEAMDAASINSTSFTVQGAAEPALVGSVSLDAETNTASFIPNSNLTASTIYTATVTTAAKSSAGIALASNHVWTFSSGTTTDTTDPTVISTDPVDTATGVARNRNISATFSEALDPSTVKASTFTLSQGGTPVSGAVSYANRVATFNPDSNLAADTLHEARLTTAIADLAGNQLAADEVWSFTTGATVASGPAPVNLRTAGDFVILTKTGITNVSPSAITGNIGASPITAAAMDTVTCAEITGTIYGADAGYTGSGDVTCFQGDAAANTRVAQAVLDMGTAFADAAGRTTPDFTELHAGDISGQTLDPGLYKWGTGVLSSTDVTLSGGPNDVWIFQVAGNVTQENGSSVVLIDGALPKNIFWQVGGGTGVAIGTDAVFQGIVLAEKGVSVNTGSTVTGRLLAQTAVTLQVNTVTQPAP